ncbi:hypothetical protein EBX31_12170, partial [bacterium]|nr:hypothetical protein [bacterium]
MWVTFSVIQINGPPLSSGPPTSSIRSLILLACLIHHFQGTHLLAQAGPGAAVSSQTRQDMQLRDQLKNADPMGGNGNNLPEDSITAKPLPADMGDVQLISEKESKPWFFFTVDCQAFYNSNVLYASSIDNTFGAWQIITTPEIGFAPKFQDETFNMFFPRAGFRYQFFTYAQAEPPKGGIGGYPTTGISAQNFQVANPYFSIGWSFSDDLYLEFSGEASLYNGPGRDWSSYENFLNEYPVAWQATWFRSFAEIHSFSITGRASYVFAFSPVSSSTTVANNQFSRSDNNLTFAWVCNPIREINTQIYASFRLAKYTGSGDAKTTGSGAFGSPAGFTESDRLDFQQTYGASVTY